MGLRCAVAEGRDPAGVSFDGLAPPVHFTAGNWLADDVAD